MMAIPFILTAREHHGVPDVESYRERHRKFIEAKQRSGMRFAVHDVAEPVLARVDASSWIVDCACGAGNATDPAWGVAFCFGCGARYTAVFPSDASDIEQVLVQRPNLLHRAWRPGETIQDLVDENDVIGAKIPESPRIPKPRKKPAAAKEEVE